MSTASDFSESRKEFHASLFESILTINGAGVVSNADGSSTSSKAIARGVADLLKAKTVAERIAGQTSGNQNGLNTEGNLTTLCNICHDARHSKR